ncbi:LolA family protein [Streptomyces zingiberis]|uniref:DUF2092 domain-containing protein n=1 Tax=Streptomyces zingiberis TaxID=2053010 RepID=A0ABX1C4V1_9ACTN|nr:DUF2092 domain-containing protein [Streptomyces zingiberis]NJQ02947.1 DUF2092 domain-containing protein [Streptomyces zingiberis]
MPAQGPIQLTGGHDGRGGREDESAEGATPSPARRLARWGVPAAVVGVAALGIGIVPALAGQGSPDLPEISASELIAKIAESETEQLSGTVRINTDLGLPELTGLASGAFASGPGQGGDGSSADPREKLMELVSGSHTLRVAADGPERQRLSLVGGSGDSGEYTLVHNGQDLWAYDAGSNAGYHAKLPEEAAGAEAGKGGPHRLPDGVGDATPQDLAEQALKAVGDTTSVTVDGTARIAGRDAYQLVIAPRAEGSTVKAARISVDAENGVPLKFTLLPSSGGKAVIDVGFTAVDFARPDASSFAFKPPKGAEITEEDLSAHGARRDGRAAEDRHDGKRSEDGRDHDGSGLLGGLFGSGTPGGSGSGAGGPEILGEGWASVVRLQAPGAGKDAAAGEPAGEAQALLDSLGERVRGDFGEGRIFSTRLVNVLMTDDGGVYAGAVTKEALVKIAEQAE